MSGNLKSHCSCPSYHDIRDSHDIIINSNIIISSSNKNNTAEVSIVLVVPFEF